MPARAKRPCRHKGCAAITNDVSGYCDQHRQSMLVMAGATIRQVRAGGNVDTVGPGNEVVK